MGGTFAIGSPSGGTNVTVMGNCTFLVVASAFIIYDQSLLTVRGSLLCITFLVVTMYNDLCRRQPSMLVQKKVL